jgi:ABC-type phosphate/phosphonate transport system substrate-binding protein
LLVRDDTSLNGAEDLRSRKVCLVDRESTTGFLLPRIWMRSHDIDPDKDVNTIISGDHLAALRDLSEGRCDAAAVYSGAYLSAQEQGISIGTMRVLAITGRVPQDVVAASPAMPEADAARLREVLIGFDPQRDIGEARVGAVLGISGFAAYDAEEFVLIRSAAEREGMIPGAGSDGGADAGH